MLRLRLLARLQERWQRRVVVLTAGAGFGKTTLLTQAWEENLLAPRGIDLWLGCIPGDAAESALAAGLLGAAIPDGERGDDDGDVAAAVAAAVWRRAPHQVALLVDDVHEIPSGSPGAALLTRTLGVLPANGHLVLAGRTVPPLPLARLEAHGQVTRIDEFDLAFSGDELRQFASLRAIPTSRVEGMPGWPALAELAASTRPDAVADFVWEEVLSGIKDERRRLLARLAQVGPFDEEIAAAVAGVPVDLEALVARLPLVLSGPDGVELHPLWQPVLTRELDDEEIAAAQRAAAAVLQQRGDLREAVRLLTTAEAWPELRRTLVDLFGAGHARVADDVLRDWFEHLPDEVRAAPEGRLLGLLAGPVGDELSLVAEGLDSLAEEFRSLGDPDAELACLVQLGHVAWWRERHDILLGVIGRVLELDGRGHAAAGPVACVGRAILCDAIADFTRVLSELDRIPPGALNHEWSSITSWLRSMALLSLGQPEASLGPAESAVAHGSPTVRLPAQGACLHARWFCGDVDGVLRDLPALVADAQRLGLTSYVVVAAAQASVAHAIAGQVAAARSYLDIATKAGAEATGLTDAHLRMAEAQLAVADGDETGAAALLEAELARRPLLQGLPASTHLRMLTLLYVLVPSTREAWDAATLGPSTSAARDLARAVAVLREGGSPATVRAVAIPEPGRVRALLPCAWVAQLAVALAAADRPEASALLEPTWPATQSAVRALTGASDAAMARAARKLLGRLPAPPAATMELRVLGPVELHRDGTPVDTADWRRERVRTLLLHLVLHSPTTRERVVDALWPSLDPAAGGRNLRVTLTYLLRVLEPDRGEGDASFFVRHSQGSIELHPGQSLTVDCWRFEALLDEAEAADRAGSPSVALSCFEAALALWRGDPFPGAYDEWATASADRLRSRFVGAAVRAGELLLARADSAGALALAHRALDIESWSEPAHRLVVASHLARGDRAFARRALETYRAQVAALDADPDSATLMVERLLESAEQRAAVGS